MKMWESSLINDLIMEIFKIYLEMIHALVLILFFCSFLMSHYVNEQILLIVTVLFLVRQQG